MSGGSSGSAPTQQNVTSTTSNLPEYARPYFEQLMQRAQGNLTQQYQPYNAPRIAGFTPAQEQVQQNTLGLTNPMQFNVGSALAQQAGQQALGMGQSYTPGQFNAGQVQGQQNTAPQMGAAQTNFQPNVSSFQMGPVQQVSAQQVSAPNMQAAQTNYGQQQLEQLRMNSPEMFGTPQAQRYMSPYIEAALEPQLREAVFDAKRGQLAEDLGAARQGTYGGSRQLLASMERERNLGQQMGDIRARGLQSAFENAQQQFERDRSAGMTADQANLQAGLQTQQLSTQTGLQAALANLSNEQQARVNNQAMQFQAQGMNQEQAMRAALANQGVDVTQAQANQQAALQAQQLGTQTGLQAALANLDATSQANVQNLAAQLQTQGLNADQALRAALANQQTGLEAQRLGEQSRQFGSQQGLAGLELAGQMGQTLGNLGQYQQTANLQRLQAQGSAADQQRGLQQQYLDQAYADFLRQRDFPMEMLGQYSNLLRGLPMNLNTTQTTYAPPPSMASQVLGTGLGALGLTRTLGS